MKSKLDFYIAFYERLALQGFQTVADSTKKNLADIGFKGYFFAHLTKTDHIIPNTHANIPLGAMEQLNYIARETAQDYIACTEKPYDETKHHEFSDGSYKLAEAGGFVMACAPHHLFGYVFSTFKYPNEIGQTEKRERQTFFSQSDAARDFAVRSGLVDERLLFSEKELVAIHNGLSNFVMTPGNGLDFEAGQEVDGIIERIENLIPALASRDISSDLEHENDLSEGVEQ